MQIRKGKVQNIDGKQRAFEGVTERKIAITFDKRNRIIVSMTLLC